MFDSKNILYIVSALAAIEKINLYTQEFISPGSLLEANNQMNFNATTTLLIAIAEETKKIDENLLEKQPDIKWQNISEMRNILAHDYRGVDPEIVFDVIKNEVPKLKIAFIEMIFGGVEFLYFP